MRARPRPDIRTTPTPLAGGLVLPRLDDPVVLCTVRDAVKRLACDDARAPRFPGPNPVSLDSSHFPRLASKPYFLCEKTDGVRYLLACARVRVDGEDLDVCVLLDRRLTAYVLPLRHVPTAMFQGSLLDGELAWNKARSTWDYLVFDAVRVSGVPVLGAPLTARMAAVHRALAPLRAVDTAAEPVRLVPKDFWAAARFDEFERHLRGVTARYDVDGVILTPAADPVVYGRHFDMFKLKCGGARHTVDFRVAADGRGLEVFDAGAHVRVAAMDRSARPGAIVECGMREDGAWEALLTRKDKATANDLLTYEKTLLNMKENLGVGDLRRALGV